MSDYSKPVGIHYKIRNTEEGYEIYKYNGNIMIGLMGIVQSMTQAVSICKRLMDGLARNDWA